jgi:ribokinase
MESTESDLHLHLDKYRYETMIGTGGIGSGVFLLLRGDHTLGREESRSVKILERRDYCKLHIVSHYLSTLLGSPFHVIPIGKVGDDPIGDQLIDEMKCAGMDLHFVEKCVGVNTTFSYCYLYPNGEGGNLTVENAASSLVDSDFIGRAEPHFSQYADRCVAIALPEVPMKSREEFLRLASRFNCFRVASFLSGEIHDAIQMDLIDQTDLLAINMDEAAKIADLSYEGDLYERVIHKAVDRLSRLNPKLSISITGGIRGSWFWGGRELLHQPAYKTSTYGTAGAGDAYLAGFIIGLVAGMEASQMLQIANLIAAFSVTSPHTIHPYISRQALGDFITTNGFEVSKLILEMLSNAK